MVYGCKDFNYKDRLFLLELPSLEERRVRGDLIETFKLLKGIAELDYHILSYKKIVKNSFCRDVRKNVFTLVIEL